jgi:branched-chain amino acid transport system substrate-binding protein
MFLAQKLRYRVGCGAIEFTSFLFLELSMQMKLKLTVAAAITVVGGMALAQEVVKIGHVAPMSGGQAHYGKDNENGVRMAIEVLNAQNLTIGGKKVKFEIAAEDDAADPKQGTAVAQKLCDAKVAGVVGHLNSGTTIPASKIYNDCGIPHITGAATNPNLTKPGYKTTYRIIANDNSLGAGLAVYAAKTMKLKRIAVIDDRTAYGQGVAEVFKKTALADGIQIVDDQYTTDKATDFMAILTSIKSKNPDGVFYGGMDAQAGAMLRQMDQLGMSKVKFFGGDGICTAELIKIASGAKTLDGVVCAEGGASIAKMPGGTAWKAKYDAKYPGQFQIYSPFTYDATFVLVDAMKRANSTDPKVYIPKITETNFKGVTANIAFEPNGELKNPSMTLSTYKDGKKVSLN